MDMNSMMDRCMDAMKSMMGGGMMGNGIILVLLSLVFLVWVVGLGVVGALIFWGIRRFSSPHAQHHPERARGKLATSPFCAFTIGVHDRGQSFRSVRAWASDRGCADFREFGTREVRRTHLLQM
jgi:hypothetical protein